MTQEFIQHKPFIDLSCGTGGFSLGLMNVGFKPVLAIDNDESCVGIYNRNLERVAVHANLAKVKGQMICSHLGVKVGAFPLIVGMCLFKDRTYQYLYHFFRVTREITPHMFAVVTSEEFLSKDKGRVWQWRFNQRRVFEDYRWNYFHFRYTDFGIPIDRAGVIAIAVHRRMKIKGFEDIAKDLTLEFPIGPPVPAENLLWGLPKPDKNGMACPTVSGHRSKWRHRSRKCPVSGIVKNWVGLSHPIQDRPITRRELCRIVGLPDWYELPEWYDQKTLWDKTLHPLIASYIGAWALRVDRIYKWSRYTSESMNIVPLRSYESQKTRKYQRKRQGFVRFSKIPRVRRISPTR